MVEESVCPIDHRAQIDRYWPTNEGGDRVIPDLQALRAELEALLASWEYAFAMGHGCSVGDHPQHRAVRERVADLRARIAEHTS
jgi:hypothetical protein